MLPRQAHKADIRSILGASSMVGAAARVAILAPGISAGRRRAATTAFATAIHGSRLTVRITGSTAGVDPCSIHSDALFGRAVMCQPVVSSGGALRVVFVWIMGDNKPKPGNQLAWS